MWPFKKKKEEENIIDSLKRLGFRPQPHVYRNEEVFDAHWDPELRPDLFLAPDDGKFYGEYSIIVDNVSIKFYVDDKDPRRLQAIRANPKMKMELEFAKGFKQGLKSKEEQVEILPNVSVKKSVIDSVVDNGEKEAKTIRELFSNSRFY